MDCKFHGTTTEGRTKCQKTGLFCPYKGIYIIGTEPEVLLTEVCLFAKDSEKLVEGMIEEAVEESENNDREYEPRYNEGYD